MVGSGVIGVQLNGAPEFLLGSLPVTIMILDDQRQSRVGIGKVIVEFEGPECRSAGFVQKLSRWNAAITAKQRVRVRHCGVRLCVIRVTSYRLLEVVDRLP